MQTIGNLYPLTFQTLYKDRIWGGTKLKTLLGKDIASMQHCGESWELSSVKDNISKVAAGTLAGKELNSLIEEYKGKLVGNAVYEKYGTTFPLLVKFLDAQDDLSIQVHPDDTLAQKRHNSFGKTEMWYVLQADPEARLRVGFNRTVDRETYLRHLKSNTLDDILNLMPVAPDDVVFLPAGRIHSLGKGLVIAEIQQTSDITYRVYDFDRKDAAGKLRDLHTEEALDAMDYTGHSDYKTNYKKSLNEVALLVESPYFTTNRLHFNQPVKRDYANLDSFVIYTCIGGQLNLAYADGQVEIKTGEVVLLPASIDQVTLTPVGEFKVLETYIS
jgi:mannose-6-phosphate isomerase